MRSIIFPRGPRVVSLVGRDCGRGWAVPRNSHLPAMIIAGARAFSNDQWPIAGANLLRVHFPEAGISPFGSVADGHAQIGCAATALDGRQGAQGHPARYLRLCLADRCAAAMTRL